MNTLLKAALAGASVAVLAASAASAATVLNWNAGDTGLTQSVNFNGYVGTPASPTVIPGLSAAITYTLASVTNGGQTWTFDYAVANTSSAPTTGSRIRSFGFDLDSVLASASSTGTYGFASTGPNIPNGIGTVDVCFKPTANADCTGGPGGLTIGQSGGGTLKLNFASAQSSIDFNNLFVRYQSVAPSDISGSASGVPTTPIPEPATWAMMIAGFGLAGATFRLRRRALAAA